LGESPGAAAAAAAARAHPGLLGLIGRIVVDDWFTEPPYAGIEQRYRVLARVHAETTPWQTLEVLDLEGPGRALILAGTLQTGRPGGSRRSTDPRPVLPTCSAHPRASRTAGAPEWLADFAAPRMAGHGAGRQAYLFDRSTVSRVRADLPGHAVELGHRIRRN